MKIGDLAILRFADEQAEMFYSVFSIEYAPNDVILIEDINTLLDGELVAYLSTHTGKRDWLRTEDFIKTFKIITTENNNDKDTTDT